MSNPVFKSVLIANRGEIAVRVIAACQEMGIRAIAVYSDADRDAMHVRAADEAYRIGPAPARESYLNIDAILDVARARGAEAIHPGYGFLSENAAFADACALAGVVFIGPPPEAIRLMGSKTAAKRAVEARGVPTVPGYNPDDGATQDASAFAREAARIGYPLMIKAAVGGGGKGMRAVASPAELAEALAAAQREALAAFGDASVFLEKLIVAPRHIEFQILADRYGNTIHLGERECSIQRRHQKVIEESPSAALTPELRAAMGTAAVRAAQAAGYVNAGTCEFLLDASGRFYFLEMNTRLQVEHPVTESVTGLDLVRHQLRIAAGEPLGMKQEQIVPRGHAIEARLYAEDPAKGYLPSTGRVLVFAPPRAAGVRVDAGIAAGDEVTIHYDPMLAKLIVAAEDRPAAIGRLGWALEHFAVLGVATNAPLLGAIAADADFQAGQTTTAFLETHDLARLSPFGVPTDALAAAALWEALAGSARDSGENHRDGPYNPWTAGIARAAGGAARQYRYRMGDGEHVVTLTPAARAEAGAYHVTVDGRLYPTGHPAPEAPVAASVSDHQLLLDVSGKRVVAYVARRGYEVLVSLQGQSCALAKPQPLDVESAAHAREGEAGVQQLVAPMAGTLIKVNVRKGDRVGDQQTVAILGAMKMEHAIVAPYAGRIRRVAHAAGDVVPGGEVLVELEPSGEE
jgi:3-methylcrotonyl-CoA carboxylase alpha subunit